MTHLHSVHHDAVHYGRKTNINQCAPPLTHCNERKYGHGNTYVCSLVIQSEERVVVERREYRDKAKREHLRDKME